MDRMTKLVAGRLKVQTPTGPHPEPELLSAFAENAISEAERGPLLQHLGACSDCREILYLALPESPEMQKVLVPQPRPFMFRRWIVGWVALAASVVVVAVFFTTNRLEHKSESARMAVPAPAATSTTATENAAAPAAANRAANGNETKIAADKVPQELDQLQAARAATLRDPSKSKMAAALEKNESTPQLEAKHMTAKPQATMDFDESGQVHVSAPTSSAAQNADQIGPAQSPGSRTENLPLQGRNVGAPLASTAAVAPPAPPPTLGGIVAGGAIGSAYSRRDVMAGKIAKGNLGGMILDPSGAVVANAKVTLIGTDGQKSAVSDSAGRFSFATVAPGSYSVKAEANGFKATEIKQVAVLGDKPAALDVRLEVGTASEVVEVTGAAPAIAETHGESMDATGASSGYVAQSQATSQDLSVLRANSASSRLKDAKVTSGSKAPAQQWTISPDGAVQRSGDGGKTWQPTSAPGGAFRALSALGANIWVGGKAGALYHSADSGQSWVKCAPAAGNKKLDQDIVRVEFSDSLTGIVSTANGEVWTTSDAGQTWLLK
jgi:hypothetical protein